MVKYKVNLKFKENGESLNDTITEVLKIELQKMISKTCNILNLELPIEYTHYSQAEGEKVNEWK